MIPKTEIEAKAQEFDIHVANVERDYVFGWLLAGIARATTLPEQLSLRGGNAFRKAYFEHARFSRDLDFASPSGVRMEDVAQQLNHACEYVEKNAGVTFLKDMTRVETKRGADEERQILEARLYFKDFYGNPEKITISVRMDISQYARIILPVQDRPLIHAYSDRDVCAASVKTLKLEELLASKLKCLLQRRHSADLYDFVYAVLVSPSVEVDRAQIINAFLQMTIFRPYPGIVRDLLVDLPFAIIKGLWEKYLECPRPGILEFDHAVTSFKTIVTEMFGPLPSRGGERAFFPSQIRNVIMEAGNGLTLLNIVYDGVRRVVEPYCLAYKTRKDGVSREYFYVYDRTGGRRSGPGIKSLVHTGMSSIENTTETFTPRYEVELAKAGEKLNRSYFSRTPGRPPSSSSFARLRSPSIWPTASHTIACTYCGKRFKRASSSTSLNPHKDRNGYPCPGRTGYHV